ncbi:hypothetical protein KCP78_02725 [Salmonella enterica subsp. enterica]|nr:hypothetical protein KCP78_02725 [Salmonella enterica subsp. enterica]
MLIQVILFPFATLSEVTNATIAIYNEDNGKTFGISTQRLPARKRLPMCYC